MNLERLLDAAVSNRKGSINLEKLFARSVSTTNEIESQKLRAKTQLLEYKQKTYNLIADSQSEKENKGDPLNKVLGSLGLAGLARGLKGAKAPVGVAPKPRLGGPRIGRGVAGFNVLLGGIDFMQRRSAGQSNLQAGIGAGAGVAGGVAGATLGAKIGAGLGTLIAPGVGTIIGGGIGSLIGGGIGAMAAGNIADKATGVDAGEAEVERRVQEEEKKTSLLITKTPFSGALDTFDAALDKLASFPGGICACAGKEPPAEMFSIQRTKDQIQETFERGYSKGFGEGRVQGGVAGFVAGVAIVGGVLFLTRGKGGPLVQRIGQVADLIPKTPKAPEIPRTDPSKVRVLPKEELPTPTPTSKPTSERIMQSIFGEKSTPKNASRVPRDPKTGKSQELIEEVIDTPKRKIIIRRSASKVEKETPEEFFQKQELKGIKKQVKQRKKIRSTLEPEPTPIGPQSSLSGGNIVALAEPNTTIVPVPVGGGAQVIGGSGASPYQAAAKYAQMMSQITA